MNREALSEPETVGIHSLDHFAMTVPDLHEAKRFFQAFGLDVKEEDGALSLYTFGSPHLWARLRKGPSKRLNYLSFSAYADDLPRFEDRLNDLGIDRIDAPKDAPDSGGLWFLDLNNIPLQVRDGCKKTPDAKEGELHIPSLPGRRNAPLRGAQPPVHPSRLSHILLLVPNVLDAVEL